MLAALTTTIALVNASDGSPVFRAEVLVTTASGRTLRLLSNDRGIVIAPGSVVHVRVVADRCATLDSNPEQRRTIRLMLRCEFPVIGSVKVATGTSESLHRLPVAAAVLDSTAIAQSSALSSDELMRALPGYDRNRSNSAFTNYGQLRVSFTGAGQDRGLVLADGIPAQDGFGGQIDWAEFPVSDIARVELLRGAGSALYGAGAIGGVLEIDTTAPPADIGDMGSAFGISSGSHGYASGYAQTSAQLAKHLFALAMLDQEQLQYFDLPPAYASPTDRAAQSQDDMESLQLRYAPSAATLIDLTYRGAFDYQQEGRRDYDFWRRLAEDHLRVQLPRGDSLVDFNAYVRNAFVTNRSDAFPQDPGTLRYTQYVPTSERGASIGWSESAASLTFQARLDQRDIFGVSTQLGPTNALESAGSGDQQITGFALQETLRAARLELIGGARVDQITFFNGLIETPATTTAIASRIARAVSPRAALRYNLSSKLALRASTGGGFRAPFLNELLRGYQIGRVIYEPNAHLSPERSSSSSLGLDYADGSRHFSLDYIETYVNDAIMFRTINATHQMLENVDHTQTNGLALTYQQGLGACSRVTGSLGDQYARVTGGDPSIVGKRLPLVPSVTANAQLDSAVGSTQAGLSLAYLGQTYYDDLNTEPLGTSIVAGAHIAIPLREGARLIFSADNLTGARYLSSIDRYGLPTILSVGFQVPMQHLAQSLPEHCRARGPQQAL